ncbi:MAG: undecaprenyldiphospho-muramoylpentapeptide beta-N-acetylglucosaminyltransferase [Desulfobacterales bacterium]|nr:undecaprenyldiphospho-muramoylpentapeptide beta-N-acetylglucosaminyltransferase [Desulfobacterales bacterium]
MPGVLEAYNEGTGYGLIVAGGGTGGHLFPGVAVAQAFLARHIRNRVLFVNAGRPLDVAVLDRLGWEQRTIAIEGIKGRGVWRQARAAGKIPKAVCQSRRIIRDFKPQVVMGVGGYSAGPVAVAAWLMGIPTVLHEQNQEPGLTNRWVRRIATRVYLSFEDASGRFDAQKTLLTGNPVRDEILMRGVKGRVPHAADTFTVLVLGGSQGAHAINEAMVAALPDLAAVDGLRVVHQTGRDDEAHVAKAYAEAGLAATVRAFFDDMAERYAQADLIVCRAGATTVAEITVVGRAALFIPFPQAADDHQTANARSLVDAGAAEMIRQRDLTGALLAERIAYYRLNPATVSAMATKALTLGRPEAALTIVRDIYRLIESGQPAGGGAAQ